MRDALAVLAIFALGATLGWWLRGLAPAMRKRVLQVTGIVLGAPVGLFVVALGLQSDTLAFTAGLSLMMMLAVLAPLGLGALLGAYLARPRYGSPGPPTKAQPAASPRAAKRAPFVSRRVSLYAQHRGLLVGAAGFGAAVWIALTLGFRLNEDYVPVELEQGLVPAAAVLIASVFLGLRAVWQQRRRVRAYEQRDLVAEHEAFLAAMAPKYDLDPHATACCEHLAAIESAMRTTGMQMRLAGPRSVKAECCVDTQALARLFALPKDVSYQEWYGRDGLPGDPPASLVYCEACPSHLWVLHASERRPDTPTFPSSTPVVTPTQSRVE
jgi:hypothetical protein